MLIMITKLFPKNKLLLLVTVITMLFVGFFRGKYVGTDYLSYCEDYEYLTSLDRISQIRGRTELGFFYLLYFLNNLHIPYFVVYGSMFAFTLVSFIKFASYKNVDKSWFLFLFFMLGYYFMSFNIIRQLLTIGIILNFIPLLEKKKYINFCLAVSFVSLILHKSELIFILLIPLHYYCKKNKTINKRFLFLTCISSFVIYYLGKNYLFYYILTLISLFGMSDQYSLYIELASERESIGNITSLLYTLLTTYIIFVKNNSTYKFETTVFVFSIAIFNIGNVMASFAYRLFLDFNVYMLIIIPLVIQESRKWKKNATIAAILMFCFAMFANRYYYGNAGEVKPYYTIFERNE